MTDNARNPVPAGVAALFALCAIYLGIAGAWMLLRPGTIPLSAGAPLLFGLELSGPYMFLLMAIVGGGVAWGLGELNNIVRHAAVLIAIAGIVMLVPSVSAATAMVQAKALAFGGLGMIVRVMVAWYRSRGEVADRFKAPPGTRQGRTHSSLQVGAGTAALGCPGRAQLDRAPAAHYFFARAATLSPTRSLTLNVIFPVFLSPSTTT
jgi:hypothetical protein